MKKKFSRVMSTMASRFKDNLAIVNVSATDATPMPSITASPTGSPT